MKGIHWIDLGQWPPAMVVTADKRAYRRFMRSKCGKHPFHPFPSGKGGHCTELKSDDGDLLLVIAIGEQPDHIELATALAHESYTRNAVGTGTRLREEARHRDGSLSGRAHRKAGIESALGQLIR